VQSEQKKTNKKKHQKPKKNYITITKLTEPSRATTTIMKW
jgi:hypothetical protein